MSGLDQPWPWLRTRRKAYLHPLPEPHCSRDQYQSGSGENPPSGSRHVITGGCETFRRDGYGDDPHGTKIHDSAGKQHHCQVCACEYAAKAQSNAMPPRGCGIRRKPDSVIRCLPAASQVMHLPGCELECARKQYDHADSNRNSTRQLVEPHLNRGKCNRHWIDQDSGSSPH